MTKSGMLSVATGDGAAVLVESTNKAGEAYVVQGADGRRYTVLVLPVLAESRESATGKTRQFGGGVWTFPVQGKAERMRLRANLELPTPVAKVAAEGLTL